jgi:uncharacterized protein (DUF302 family)
VELQKDLAEKGLTGTLKTVEDHIAKSSKAGMVVVGAFKQARNATHDLQLELGAMSGALKSNSAAFAAGKMSYKDYYAFTKSLGGQQFAMAKDFITTTRASKGFNNQLKSGDADVRTTAKALQQMLGGVTGMRTALMLSGNSAKQFASNVQQVQKASLEAGADVLGWNKTQETLAVKTDKAKASLQVLAVEVGDSLLPALSKLAEEGEHAIGWIDGLSHTQKEMLGWSLGVLAALGPVLSIGGKLATVGRGIGTFTATAATKLATLAGVSTETSVVIAASMRATTAALSGAGVGLALGEVTRNSSDTTKAVGALGAALTGAAIGFGVGGPWGAAIGGAVGGLSDLAMGFFDSGDAAKSSSTEQVAAAQRAKQAILDQRQAVDALSQAILADNDAVKANTRATVENDLQKSGAFALANKLGISTKTITDAVLGNVKAQQKLASIAAKVATQPGLSLVERLTKQGPIGELNALLTDAGVNLHKAAMTADEYAEANGKLNLAARSVAEQFALYGASLDADTQVGMQNIRFIDSHIAALTNQRAAGKLTTAGFDAQISALNKQLSAYGYSTGQVVAFTRALQRVPKKVLTHVEKDGVTANEIQELINKYGGLPKSKQTEISVKDKATPAIDELGHLIGAVTGKKYTARVDANTAPAVHKLNALEDLLDHVFGQMANPPAMPGPGRLIGAGHAAGGLISGPGTGTSDSILARLSDGEFVSTAASAARNAGALAAGNAGAVLAVAGPATGEAGPEIKFVYDVRMLR